jgi:hypothetical protein
MAQDEGPRAIEAQGGLSIHYRGHYLYSRLRPREAPERFARAFDAGPECLVLVASPLLGYGLDRLVERLHPSSAALCVEADPALDAYCRRLAPEAYAERPRLAFAPAGSARAAVDAAMALGSYRRLEVARLSPHGLDAAFYEDVAKAIRANLGIGARNKLTAAMSGRAWTRNLVANLEWIASAAPLPRIAGACVVCGAGESLERAIPALARDRGRAFIIACDTALGCLLESGIAPDLVLALESRPYNVFDFHGAAGMRIAVAADLSAHPASFRVGTRPASPVATRFAPLSLLGRLGGAGLLPLELPPLGSVGVAAYALARKLSDGPIALLGLDFAFKPGKSHARGSLFSKLALSGWSRLGGAGRPPSFGEPIGGGLLTNAALKSYAAQLAELCASDGAVFDCRDEGLDLGLPRAGLADFLREAPKREPAPCPEIGEEERGARAKRLIAFANSERALLGRLYQALKSGGDVAGLLKACDYLHWHFPDAGCAREGAPDYLNRVLVELIAMDARWACLEERLKAITRRRPT